MSSTDRQSGSVASFIIIGVVLIALLLGGLQYSKQRARQVATADTGTTSDIKSQEDKSTSKPAESTETKKEETKPATETKQEAPKTESKPESKPATQETKPSNPTPTPAPATPAPTTGPSTTQTVPQTAPSTGPTHIASTGPADMLSAAAGVLAVSLGLGSYVTSRRTMIRTARQ
jgi:FtsZ-interacting cell division protein ZipA